MTVLDNIMTGRNLKMRCNFLQPGAVGGAGAARGARSPQGGRGDHRLPRDPAHPKTQVGAAYGLQKRVELGRALAAEAGVLLLDEPMAGMNLEEKRDMCRFVLDVNDHYGTTSC